MSILSTEEKLSRHIDFWTGAPQKRPLTCFRLGTHFFSRQFEANLKILEKGHIVTPDQVIVDDFLKDYERMYQESEQLDQDCFYSAEPCTGFPWMEGIFGAAVVGSEVSFVSHPIFQEPEELLQIQLDKNNGWYQKYLEFTSKLTSFAKGRFSVSQPILRGVTDTAGSLLGQMNLVYGIMDEPELFQKVFSIIAEGQRELIADQYKRIKPFHNGYSFGFYHIWAPGSIMWYQEDLASLLSLNHYDSFLYQTSSRYIEGYDYSLVHLHPTSFIHLERILSLPALSAVQINKDEGMTMEDLIPACRKVLDSGKRLIVGMGYFTPEDIDVIYSSLPHHSTAINIISPDLENATMLLNHINSKVW